MTRMVEVTAGDLCLRFATAHALLEHCREEMPHEACGLVVACDGDGPTRVLPLRNNTTRDRRHAWLVHEEDYLAALNELGKTGEQLLAVYHSHPEGPGVLSPQDELNLAQDAVRHHLLVNLRTVGEEPWLTSWRRDPITGGPLQERVVILDG